jgi:hypothetical protein
MPCTNMNRRSLEPEVLRKLSEVAWREYQHKTEILRWPWWRRLIHSRLRCLICRPEKVPNAGLERKLRRK